MQIMGYSSFEGQTNTPVHMAIGNRIMSFLSDLGENCDVILEYDEQEGPFSFLFTGTTLSILFDEDGVSVVDYNLETGEDTVIQTYAHPEVNAAVLCLVTQVNQAN